MKNIQKLPIGIKVILFTTLISGYFCGMVSAEISGAIFGKRGGHFHPFITMDLNYTDNFNYSDQFPETEYLSLITPGLLVSYPGKKLNAPGITILNVVSPGARKLTGIEKKPDRRFQSSIIVDYEILNHKENSELDVFYPNIESMVQYSMRGGLSLKMSAQYQEAQDSMKNNDINNLPTYDISKYVAKVFESDLFYRLSDKIEVGLEYTGFNLDYRNQTADFIKDRMDHFFLFSFSYYIFEKTALFLETDVTDISYGTMHELDSILKNYYIGVQWDLSEKFQGNLRGGWGIKDLADPEIDKSQNFIFQGSIYYAATSKVTLGLDLFRGHTETDIKGTDYILQNSFGGSYSHMLNDRLSFFSRLYVLGSTYKGGNGPDGGSGRNGLANKSYMATLMIKYILNGWLQVKMDYSYETRISDFPGGDYDNNIAAIGLQACL